MILCTSVFIGRPQERQTWCQKYAVSLNGLTVSFQPGIIFFFSTPPLLTGHGRASSAANWIAWRTSQVSLSTSSQCSAFLHLTSLQETTTCGTFIWLSLSSKLILYCSFSCTLADLQDGLGSCLLGSAVSKGYTQITQDAVDGDMVRLVFNWMNYTSILN